MGPKETRNTPISARSIAKANSKNLEVVSYRRNVQWKKQPRLNNMKQIFISTPNHAKVNLCSFDSGNYSCDNSPRVSKYRENRGAMSQLKIRAEDGLKK